MVVIHSNRTVLPAEVREAYVSITHGKIVDISRTLPAGDGYQLEEVGNCVLMPGVMDTHVHINEPGRTEWEGFNTATLAAISGGITSLVDMPLNSSPVTTTVAAFEEKLAAAKGQVHANIGFWGGVVPGNDKEIQPLVDHGVLGFKAFLTHSGIDEFPNVTEYDLRKVMPIIAKSGLPLLVHCELTDTIQRSTGNPRSYNNYLASRPREWEDDAIRLMIRLCEEFACWVHIVHLSSASAIGMLQQAREKGLPITVETGQHYLYFNAEEIKEGSTHFKCAPPIREKANNELLWDALQNGIIDLVATDHSPATPGLKELDSGDFLKAWGGISSLQWALPVLLTAARRRSIDLPDIIKWLCENPARLAGKGNSKGKIAKGFDADLLVLNDQEKFTVMEEMILHRHKITPYLGEELYGVVDQTWLAGNKVYESGHFLQLQKGEWLLNR